MPRTATIPLIEISGDARQRGRQHGEAARPQIATSIAFYREAFGRSAGLTWSQVQERVPRWVPVIEAYLPGITDEIRGIAEGSGFRFEEILALNGRGEFTAGDPFAHLDESTAGCTSYFVSDETSGDGHVYCGQNWDWRSGINDTVVILRVHQPPKPTIIMQVEAGQVGRHGANSAGIALNANGLGGRFGNKLGIPQPYIRRKVLDAVTMHDALAAVFESTQSICTNLLISHRDGEAIDLETTPGRHGWMYPTDGVLVHANHFMAFVPEELAKSYRPFSPDSLYRVGRVQRALKRAPAARDPEAMRAVIASGLRDHFGQPDSVCNHADPNRHELDRTETIASSIIDLTTGEYHMTFGLPCENEYRRLPWNLYDESPAPGLARPAPDIQARAVAL
jgi:isopenicillin-N N-acyltransferase-like protein